VLVEAAPERFFVPPYVGKSGWIGLDLARTSDVELEVHAAQVYRMIAPKKLIALLT
jgi:hypothetical protein